VRHQPRRRVRPLHRPPVDGDRQAYSRLGKAVLQEHVFARNFAKHGMLAYVRGVLRQERLNDVETLQYQKWSGAHYYDELIKTISGGVASTAAMGKGTTEDQFKH
ncbi:isocitrate lyase family-domain-containing protein, partial [Jimgerdemannia flammicorona]